MTTDADPWLARALKRVALHRAVPAARNFIASSKIFGLPMLSTFRAFLSWFAPRGASHGRCAQRQIRRRPRGANVRIQGMDAGWMARSRGEPGKAWSLDNCDRRPWRNGAPLLENVWRGVCEFHQLEWPQTMKLLSGACVYIGPDTSTTHLAAATGCPTVALFGPMDPRVWGHGQLADSQRRGTRAAPSRTRAMSGSCRILCRACLAPSRAANATSAAAAFVSTSSSPSR